ncbi:MAG: hypothetical protein RLZ92_1266 [Pseudomonadota bacterium]|jgi:succinate dehydrogenase / fumarate reductase cytochrome b subunit
MARRPLSPHLQIYRLPLTGLISISHRITGVCLSLGLVGVLYLIISIAAGEVAYQAMQVLMGFWLAKLAYWGFVLALFFHLCHGVRHLIWDAGGGFDRAILQRLAIYELLATALLTLFYFLGVNS